MILGFLDIIGVSTIADSHLVIFIWPLLTATGFDHCSFNAHGGKQHSIGHGEAKERGLKRGFIGNSSSIMNTHGIGSRSPSVLISYSQRQKEKSN